MSFVDAAQLSAVIFELSPALLHTCSPTVGSFNRKLGTHGISGACHAELRDLSSLPYFSHISALILSYLWPFLFPH